MRGRRLNERKETLKTDRQAGKQTHKKRERKTEHSLVSK